MSARNWTLGLAIGAVLAAAAPAAAAGPGADRPVAARAALPDGLGPCVPGRCPDPYPPVNSDGVLRGRDNGIAYPFNGDLPDCGGRVPVTGSVSVLKRDAATGAALAGARFELWRDTNGTAGLQTRGINADRRAADGCATDRGGVCDSGPLPEGFYHLVETAVPEGYALPADRVTGPLRLDSATPERRLLVTLRNERDGHGKGKKDQGHGKGGHPGHPKDAKGPRA
ncbi:SpaA isopeptide-forming pilin-related protein [Streptomyces virginiae]|uniref:SpaA isopeptide-forming pilin-related protein n=1 Tax=Streptomyces virginiae TaxID=1961 RepID=UPI0036EE03A3